jgi:hypothetical protein
MPRTLLCGADKKQRLLKWIVSEVFYVLILEHTYGWFPHRDGTNAMVDSTAYESGAVGGVGLRWWLMVRSGDRLAGIVDDFGHGFERQFRVCLIF